jgi:hypothetical protein
VIQRYTDHYNTVRLQRAIGIRHDPGQAGRQEEIHAARDRKLEKARLQRHCAASRRA